MFSNKNGLRKGGDHLFVTAVNAHAVNGDRLNLVSSQLAVEINSPRLNHF